MLLFLQNIQDTKSNSFRIMKVHDHLQQITNPFQFNTTQITSTTNVLEENVLDKEDNFLEGEELDTLITHFQQNLQTTTQLIVIFHEK